MLLRQQVPLYDSLAVDYDRFVNWEGRLAHELPFFLSLFQEHGVRMVLDSACGTGHHALALSRQGYTVSGADLSTGMIDLARENAAAQQVQVSFEVAGLGALVETFGTVSQDAVLCLGNSLPHLLSATAVQQSLADFAGVLRPGGLAILQNRNFDRVWAERDRFMPPQSYRDAAGDWLFVRFYDFHPETVTFNMIRLWRTEGDWQHCVEATELRPIFHDDLASALAAAGFGEVGFYGGYDCTPFDPTQSGDLIAVAIKSA
jgi:SAM-dependent methyltransferase